MRRRLALRLGGRSLGTALAVIASTCLTVPSAAQPRARRGGPVTVTRPPPSPAQASSDDPGDLRARFGTERARHLLRSSDPDERLRGVERAAATDAPEALTVLIQQLDASATTRGDARAKIAIARGLASHVGEPAARAALLQLVEIAVPKPATQAQRPETEEFLYAPRLETARSIAALALAQSSESRAVESLVAIARGTSVGSDAAAAALIAFPSSGSATWAKPVSVTTARLAARTGDLRALGALLEAASAPDASTRAAAIDALGTLGDARVLPLAVSALSDDEPRVRTAATTALVRLGAPEAARAVEELLADDATAGEAIELARGTHSLGIVHALAARAAIAADLAVRSAAVGALGRDPSDAGIEALAALVADPMLRADAANAIARSPSRAAMSAIERLAATPATRRLAARAYLIRVRARAETSQVMDRAIADLAKSGDERDRALGAFAQIVLGAADARRWLDDDAPAVRRAAAMATLGAHAMSPGAEGFSLLAKRRAHETDAASRAVLGLALLDEDASAQVPTGALRLCAHAGGADAALCTLALARRATEADAAEEDALLSARDALVRAHAARGLARSEDPTRSGRLAAAYAYEPDPLVRRALLAALAELPADGSNAPSVAESIALAARLDPDPEVRSAAIRLAASRLLGSRGSRDGRDGREGDEDGIAWIHLVDPSGAPPPPGQTGALLRADGLAVPIAFDADGDALVPGVPPGTARLVLAPRLDAAYAPTP